MAVDAGRRVASRSGFLFLERALARSAVRAQPPSCPRSARRLDQGDARFEWRIRPVCLKVVPWDSNSLRSICDLKRRATPSVDSRGAVRLVYGRHKLTGAGQVQGDRGPANRKRRLSMAKFLVLARSTGEAYKNRSPQEMQQILQKYMAWAAGLRDADRMLHAEASAPAGRVVRGSGPGMMVTDGPFAESKEVLGLLAARSQELRGGRGLPQGSSASRRRQSRGCARSRRWANRKAAPLRVWRGFAGIRGQPRSSLPRVPAESSDRRPGGLSRRADRSRHCSSAP